MLFRSLGVPVPDLAGGAGIPLLWHWVYLLEQPAQRDLGPDGSTLSGVMAACSGLRGRRMWAGGCVRTSGPLTCGLMATKRSRVLTVQEKHGESGPLTFIKTEHQILQRDQIVVDEKQDIVYREAAPAPGQPPGSPVAVRTASAPDVEWAIEISPALLFRFSALTYNAHRIHYDRDYARDVEGYPGLVTHGPLQALVMAETARATGYPGGARLHFDYRLTSPLFDHQGLVASADKKKDAIATTVRDACGRSTAAGLLRALADGPQAGADSFSACRDAVQPAPGKS